MFFSVDNYGKTCTLKLVCQLFAYSLGLGSSVHSAAVLHTLGCANAHPRVQAGIFMTLSC